MLHIIFYSQDINRPKTCILLQYFLSLYGYITLLGTLVIAPESGREIKAIGQERQNIKLGCQRELIILMSLVTATGKPFVTNRTTDKQSHWQSSADSFQQICVGLVPIKHAFSADLYVQNGHL